MQKYRKENREKLLEQGRRYRQTNRDRCLEHRRKYYRDNQEKFKQYYWDRLEYYQEYYQENKEKVLEYTRKNHYKRYGITQEEYVQMLLDQEGVCAICGCPPKEEKVLAVDHDHITGKVRGLLCTRCNLRVGHLESNLFEETLAYLNKE